MRASCQTDGHIRRRYGRLGTALAAVSVAVASGLVAGSAPASAEPAAPGEAAAARGDGRLPAWRLVPTGTKEQFRGLDALDRRTAWLAGTHGTVLRTTDAGRTWRNVSPAGAQGLEFRDVEAFSATTAVVLAIGEGAASRVLRTEDGGRSWRESFANSDKRAFYNCLAFFDRERGLAISDPVDGRFRLQATSDGGRSWRQLPTAGMPAALTGEFGFAASGTCLVTSGPYAWFATGGPTPRVFRSGDAGRTWKAVSTPIAGGASAGIYSLAFRDPWHGLAIGGDYTKPTVAPKALARTNDSGRRWLAATGPGEYRSGAAWLRTGALIGSTTALAVGPTGSDVSRDGGRHWQRFDTGGFDAVRCTADGACWASGAKGRAGLLTYEG